MCSLSMSILRRNTSAHVSLRLSLIPKTHTTRVGEGLVCFSIMNDELLILTYLYLSFQGTKYSGIRFRSALLDTIPEIGQ